MTTVDGVDVPSATRVRTFGAWLDDASALALTLPYFRVADRAGNSVNGLGDLYLSTESCCAMPGPTRSESQLVRRWSI